MPATLKSVDFLILKVSDKLLLDLVDRFVETGKPNTIVFQFLFGGDPLELSPDEIKTNDFLKAIREADSFSFECITIRNHNLYDVGIRKDDARHMLYKVIVNNLNQNQDREPFFRFIDIAKKTFGEIDLNTAYHRLLTEEDKEYVSTRDVFLQRQEQAINSIVQKQSEFLKDLTERYDGRRKELEDEYESRLRNNEQKCEARLEDLKGLEQELNQRKEELNLKESKGERRKTISELIQQLDSSTANFKFSLTRPTKNMRWPVFGFTITLLICLGGWPRRCFSVWVHKRFHSTHSIGRPTLRC